MTAAIQQTFTPRSKRWTKAEYLRLVDRGAFAEMDHFYLFRGELLEMSPMQTPHALSSMKITKLLFSVFDPSRFDIRVQLPFDAPGDSMPEPDFLICNSADGQRRPHPATASLIIEVADTSLAHDRDKAGEYAAGQVAEYWIVDLNNRTVEVYRSPIADAAAALGYRYASSTIHQEQQSITPLGALHAMIDVKDLLP
jgi:Uma2 family endonuclease